MKHDDSTEVLFQGVEIEDLLAVLRLASCNILSRLENYEVPCFAFHAQGFGLDDFGLLKLLAPAQKLTAHRRTGVWFEEYQTIILEF